MKNESYLKMYIAVLDEVPDGIVPTLVAHSVLWAHMEFYDEDNYKDWLNNSFKKVVVRVNRKNFEKIRKLENVYEGHENTTLGGEKSCLVTIVSSDNIPRPLKNAKLWSPYIIDIEKIANHYVNTLSEGDIQYIKNQKKENLINLHHTFGQRIRNDFKLWFIKWTPIINSNGVDVSPNHPDSLSQKIIERIHILLNERK